MRIKPGQGKRRIEFTGDTKDLILDLGRVIDPTIASTHKDYGKLDSDIEIALGTYGGMRLVCKVRELTLPTDSPTKTVTDFFPAGSILLNFCSRVTTAIAGPTNWEIGRENNTDSFGNDLALTAGTTTTNADWTTDTPPFYFAAEENLIIQDTAGGGGTNFSAGVVKVQAIYLESVAISS